MLEHALDAGETMGFGTPQPPSSGVGLKRTPSRTGSRTLSHSPSEP